MRILWNLILWVKLLKSLRLHIFLWILFHLFTKQTKQIMEELELSTNVWPYWNLRKRISNFLISFCNLSIWIIISYSKGQIWKLCFLISRSDSSANREVKNSNKLVASPNPHLRRSNRTQPVFEQRPPVVELPLHIEHGRRTFEALNGIEALQRHAPVINRLAVGKPVNFTEMLPKYMQNHTQKPLIFEPPVHTFQPSPTHFELPNQSVPPLRYVF